MEASDRAYIQSDDPNFLQHMASDPQASVWVAASAGTGKTKVLTDRVLRLLLPDYEGRGASLPHKILCLTFTKAGASVMAIRISKFLSRWAICPEGALIQELDKILGYAPSAVQVETARQLFAKVVDMPEGLKIMTIHSFCQSVLGRFPLEAGLSPNFKLVDEVEARRFFQQARQDLLRECRSGDDPSRGAMERVATLVNEEQLNTLFGKMISEQHSLGRIVERNFGLEGLYTNICTLLDVPPGVSEEEMLFAACEDGAFASDDVRRIAVAMYESSGKEDVGKGEKMVRWLSSSPQERAKPENFHSYQSAFLTDGKLRSRLCTKSTNAQHVDAQDVLAKEGQRLITVNARLGAVKCAQATYDLCSVGYLLVQKYAAIKAFYNVLDYDDLILKTLGLLKGAMSGGEANSRWVQYKLDQGLDHILVDEAQDTNPEQWKIIEALCDEFFSGEGAREVNRTVFVVGDEKQSIYSFQRASPSDFKAMRRVFAEKITQSGRRWSPVQLHTSFRTTRTVLNSVDAVFSRLDVLAGVSESTMEHKSFRHRQAGLVELWPLFEADEAAEKPGLWEPPVEVLSQQSAAQKAADHIAKTIRGWIDNKEMLPSRGRAVEAGDIMILVRKRGAFVAQLSKALKMQGVAVSGLDRMIPGEQLGVQDFMAAARFALLPDDDLSLACFLKSPLAGMCEDGLYDIAQGREGSLWKACLEKGGQEICGYLQHVVMLAERGAPFEFFNFLMQHACPADEISGRRAMIRRLGTDALDALDEFMAAALRAEKIHGLSLQQFVYEQERAVSEIKREQSEECSQVRIMTVHGSKGLEAPIVILPDTVSVPRGTASKVDAKLLWPSPGVELDLPLWGVNKDFMTPYYIEKAAEFDALHDEESRRLLYVAMTRAEDRLYVAGIGKGKGKDVPDNCWYRLVAQGLKILGAQELESGTLRLEHAAAADAKPDRLSLKSEAKEYDRSMPEWLYREARIEVEDARDVLRPSRLEEIALSPLEGDQTSRFLRGNLTHKLLQFLPNIEPEKRTNVARNYLAHYGGALSEAIRGSILSEIIAIVDNPQFSKLFSARSKAEVPISARIEGVGVINGQVDRLYVDENEVFFIDYKTNRPSPKKPEDIPEAYLQQIRTYAVVLKKLYPDRKIRGALLWTDGPHITPVDLG